MRVRAREADRSDDHRDLLDRPSTGISPAGHVWTLAVAAPVNRLAGAQLRAVTIATMTFDMAPGKPSQPVVTLRYTVGQTDLDITQVRDPLDIPDSVRTHAQDVPVEGSLYLLIPGTGPVQVAETKEADGVSIVVNFYLHSSAGVVGTDRRTAVNVIRKLG